MAGVVTEITAQGRAAVADTDVIVRDRDRPLATGTYHAPVRTDAQGRYVATGIAAGTPLVVVADKFDCVQPAVVSVVVDRETTADVDVVCRPIKLAAQSPTLYGLLLDSRHPSPSWRWLYFDAACDGHFEAGAISDLDGSYQLSRLPLGRACLHSHGKTVAIDVRGDARFDIDLGSIP
jgi:hypothetical protein